METDKTPSPRTPLNFVVSYRQSYARGFASGILKNLSLTGAFLAHNGNPLIAGEKINLTFSVSGRERNVAAKVIWTNSVGAGVKFLPQNNRDIQIVDDLIYFVESKRSGTREILEKIFQKVS